MSGVVLLTAAMAAAVGAGSAVAADNATPPQRGSIAGATSGATYFNKPGADPAAHDAELRDCMARVRGARISNQQGPGLMPLLIGAGQDAHSGPANIESCMVVKGWRVVRLPEAEGESLKALEPQALAARLSPWIGAEKPEGEVVRWWNNDAIRASEPKIKMAFFGHKSLSVIALNDDKAAKADVHAPASPVHGQAEVLPKALKPGGWGAIPDGYALVLVHIAGLGMSTVQNINIARVSPDPEKSAESVDGRPDYVEMTPATFWTVKLPKGGRLVAYALPAGQWRVASMTGKLIVIDFCLGAPAFELKAGEVAYLGRFDAASEDLGPDMDLGPAKPALAKEPALLARLKPVSYTNGVVSACTGSLVYAYEVKGAPYARDYAWGGAAHATAARAGQAALPH